MKKLLVLVLIGVGIWYTWREGLINKWVTNFVTPPAKTDSIKCEVQQMHCTDLVRMLNSFRSGRYYESAGRLLDVRLEDANMYRDNGAVIFKLKDGTKLIHNQGLSGSEKGYLTVIFPDGYVMKYNAQGGLVSRG